MQLWLTENCWHVACLNLNCNRFIRLNLWTQCDCTYDVCICLQMVLFAAWLSLSICVIDKVEIGLDQKLSMPHVNFFRSFVVLHFYWNVYSAWGILCYCRRGAGMLVLSLFLDVQGQPDSPLPRPWSLVVVWRNGSTFVSINRVNLRYGHPCMVT